MAKKKENKLNKRGRPKSKEKKMLMKKTVVEKKQISKKAVREEEVEEEIDEEEIENFEIKGLDMGKLTTRVCNIVAEHGDDGIFQSDLWKKLKLTSRDGSRLALKLERRNIIKREKVLENGRWTYKLKIVKMPVSTETIEAAPCLICPVEQKCTIDGEVSPRTCPLIEQWVLTEFTNLKKKKK